MWVLANVSSGWLGLFTEIDKEQLEEGVVTMLKVARELLATQQARDGEGRQLEYDDQQNGSGDAV
jgi:hypothetical protein